MKRIECIATAILLALPLSHAQRPSRGTSSVFALIDVSVIAMNKPGVLNGQTVVARNGVIVSLGPAGSTPVPRDAVRIDARGKFLIPGLTDSHVHLMADPDVNRVLLDLFLANGVTTVVNLRGVPSHLKLRDQVRRGEVLGPRIFTSGPWLGDPLSGTPTTTPAEVEAAVVAQKAAGYDFVKLHGDLSRDAYRSLVTIARRENIPLIGHAPRNLGAEAMFQERHPVVAHLEEYLYAYFYFRRKPDQPISEVHGKILSLAARTANAGTHAISTLSVFRGISEQIADLEIVLKRPEVAYLPNSVGRAFGWWPPHSTYVNRFDKDTMPWFRSQYRLLEQVTKAFADNHVVLLAGTDTPTAAMVPGFSLHEELKALVAAGLTPYQALQAATVNPANALLRSESRGAIEVGSVTDLVLLDGNPLDDISRVGDIAGVMLRGRWFPKTSLMPMLERARTLGSRL